MAEVGWRAIALRAVGNGCQLACALGAGSEQPASAVDGQANRGAGWPAPQVKRAGDAPIQAGLVGVGRDQALPLIDGGLQGGAIAGGDLELGAAAERAWSIQLSRMEGV